MGEEKFEKILQQIEPYTGHIYLHVLGEPLLHKQLFSLISIAKRYGVKINITTNGVLILDRLEKFLENPIRKISFSVHCYSANTLNFSLETYLGNILKAIDRLREKTICELRFWDRNIDDDSELNLRCFKMIEEHFGLAPFIAESQTSNGYKIVDNVYVGSAVPFEWPNLNDTINEEKFCYGMRDQIAILVDGTVVPCCLDSLGSINLGNIFETPLKDIIDSERATAIYDGFTGRKAVEELCLHCKFCYNRN